MELSLTGSVEALRDIADKNGLIFVEDAAQAFGASYRNRLLGTYGSLSTISFHETKNVVSGEGGALIVNDPALVDNRSGCGDGSHASLLLACRVHTARSCLGRPDRPLARFGPRA